MPFPTRTVAITLTLAECQHLALMSNVTYWPTDTWRVKLIEAARHTDHKLSYEFRAGAQELWLMETLLLRPDPRGTKLPDGASAMETLLKVWNALVTVYNGSVVEEGPYGGADNEDNHDHSGAHGDGCETTVRSE